MAESANQIFLPWVQPGATAAIPDQATERLAPDQPAVVPLRLALTVNGEAVEQQARLYGPGDVIGIDPRQLVRLEPPAGTTDFEPNLFPLVEFDRPDFPWLFTPAKADAQGRLRPWLCLIVVRKQAGVVLRPAAGQAAPALRIAAPAVPGRELPDLAESHLWAHAQVTGAPKAALRAALDSDPARTVSRLLCPRRLDPTTEYIACLVPAFEVGRKAGLGLPVGSAENLAPAWRSGAAAPAEVTLPVYYSWEFRTGEGGDFEALVARLAPCELPASVGRLPVSIARPGFAIQPPLDPGATVGLEGALRPVGATPEEWPAATKAPFQAALAQILNAPWELATQEGASGDPVVGPPIYGRWHAGVHSVTPTEGRAAAWLSELNLDPRHRAAAALGTLVVQEQQEELMAAAWEQLGDLEQVNQRLRRAQLSRALNERYLAKTFRRLHEERLLQIVAPARSRLILDERFAGALPGSPLQRSPLAARLATSFVPQTALSAPLRRLASPRGAINRVYVRAGSAGAGAMVAQFNAPRAAFSLRERGTTTVDQVSGIIAESIRSSGGFIWVTTPVGHWERPRVIFIRMLDTFRLANLLAGALQTQLLPTTPAPLREAVLAHHEQLGRLFAAPLQRDARRALALDEIKAATLAGLDPGRAVAEAVFGDADAASPAPNGDPLEPIMEAPSFPQPMYSALRDRRQELLFPGLELVPPNTVQLLETNARFIESFMVGLNAEMGRELLWRGFPTDQRGTLFRQFWDTAGAAAPRPDIGPIHTWGARPLGANAAGSSDTLVLLIRGELLRRYPNTVIYAVKAVARGGTLELATDQPGAAAPPLEAYPIFRGSLLPDVTFIGFDLTRDQALAGDGWFFVLQQQPTEPRFGLDATPIAGGEPGPAPELRSWDDLSWAHLAPTEAALRELSHVAAGRTQLAPTLPARGVWGRNSAHMAVITRQTPVRIAIHASDLISLSG